MENPNENNTKYLDGLVDRVLALTEELAHAITDQDWVRYTEKRRALQEAKQEYKRLTGIYPRV